MALAQVALGDQHAAQAGLGSVAGRNRRFIQRSASSYLPSAVQAIRADVPCLGDDGQVAVLVDRRVAVGQACCVILAREKENVDDLERGLGPPD